MTTHCGVKRNSMVYDKQFSTKAIHSGVSRPQNKPIISPIYFTSAFELQSEQLEDNDFVYTRGGNPTRNELEAILKNLENCKYCSTFSSGLAAISAVFELLSPKDHIVTSFPLYGGTYRFFSKILSSREITLSHPIHRAETVASLIDKKTKIVFLDVPSNPLLEISDLNEIRQKCDACGALLVVDNTFNTPYNFQPLKHGADIVVYSTTKYLNGHGDILGGAVLTEHKHIAEKITLYQKGIGAIPSSFDCWLLIRSLSTLELRMQRHNSNAMRIASALDTLPQIERVIYPGLKSYPDHKVYKKYLKNFGGIITVFLKPNVAPQKFLSNLKIIKSAVSYGCIKTLATQPWGTTHKEIPQHIKSKLGLTPQIIRISVGIEDADDLIKDIVSALKEATSLRGGHHD